MTDCSIMSKSKTKFRAAMVQTASETMMAKAPVLGNSGKPKRLHMKFRRYKIAIPQAAPITKLRKRAEGSIRRNYHKARIAIKTTKSEIKAVATLPG